MKLFNIFAAVTLAIVSFVYLCAAPTNVITKERVHMASPPSALEAPVMDGMAVSIKPASTNKLESAFIELKGGEIAMAVRPVGTTNIWMEVSRYTNKDGTNAPSLTPTFADGVLIAVAVLRSNPGFATLLTQQEQVALCARVWQQQKATSK